ncbi:hypothetical protein [uncultured Aminobacterium sp.]|uniref:hypothetical protein n=1 Tax=uncultured Aminobacterium sp. TaxID=548265 RepID=UPI0004B26C1C|nr:hypothetical protein [uncultured Aminobacterium sp.]
MLDSSSNFRGVFHGKSRFFIREFVFYDQVYRGWEISFLPGNKIHIVGFDKISKAYYCYFPERNKIYMADLDGYMEKW